MEEAEIFFQNYFFERNGDFTGAFGKAVPTLHAEFNQCGLYLGDVGEDGRTIRSDVGLELDFGGDDGLENG